MKSNKRKRARRKVTPVVRRVTVTMDLPEDMFQEARHQLNMKRMLAPTGCATVTAVDRIAATVLHAAAITQNASGQPRLARTTKEDRQ